MSETPPQVGASLASGAATLRAAGDESARLDADLLLAHVLSTTRASLLTHPERVLSPTECRRYEQLIARRAAGEPVAYLLGERAWYDLTLRVTPAVLVPRPETEGLLERALNWAQRRTLTAVADIGTGSGALAIALARALPQIRVYATDLSPEALAVAALNAATVGGAGHVRFLPGDLLAPLPEPVDLIVANLPYLGEEEFATLAPDVRCYEPRLALVGGRQGHELLARLLSEAPALLRPSGALLAELGPAQGTAARAAARTAFPRATVQLEADAAGLTRYLCVYSRA